MITICKRRKTVTEHVASKGQTNNNIPLGDTTCLICYNGILRSLAEFQLYAQSMEINETDEPTMADEMETESINTILSFSKAIEKITNILYSID